MCYSQLFRRFIYSTFNDKVIYSRFCMVPEPVEKVAIQDEHGAHIQNYILGPFNEGATVTIMCVATGGKTN